MCYVKLEHEIGTVRTAKVLEGVVVLIARCTRMNRRRTVDFLLLEMKLYSRLGFPFIIVCVRVRSVDRMKMRAKAAIRKIYNVAIVSLTAKSVAIFLH